MIMLYIISEVFQVFHVFSYSLLLFVLSGVIAMAMLIIVTQRWNHTSVCASGKAIQKEIMLVFSLCLLHLCTVESSILDLEM